MNAWIVFCFVMAIWLFVWAVLRAGDKACRATPPGRPVCYVAGPYRAATDDGVITNVRNAAYVAIVAARKGYAVITPHTNSRLVEVLGNLGEEYWLAADLDILARCDLVVLLPKWRESSGTLAEVEFAKDRGIPVYEIDDLPEA